MKKLLFILLAIALVFSVGLIGCTGEQEEEEEGPEPADTIVLIASASLDGPLADIHNFAKGPVVSIYLAAAPNITVDTTTYTVEMKYYNDSSSMVTMLTNTDDIIDEINAGTAHFLLGPTCTAFLEAQAPKCATAEVVQMGMEGGATSVIPFLSAYPYSFFSLSFSNWFQIPVLAKILAEEGATTAVLGLQNDDHGVEYGGEAAKYFAKEGITISDTHAMTPGDVGACDDLVDKAISASADVLCLFGYPEFVFPIHGSCIAKSYDPKAVVLGPGACFGVYYYVIAGAAAEGVMTFATGNNLTSPAMEALFDYLLSTVSIVATDFWGHPCYWTALDFVYAAAAAEGSDNGGAGFTIDQDDYRSYLATTTISSVFGDSYFVTPDHALNATQYSWEDADLQHPVPAGYGGFLSYKLHHGEVGQWQNGYCQIIGYSDIGTGTDEYDLDNYVVTNTTWYPKPSWLP